MNQTPLSKKVLKQTITANTNILNLSQTVSEIGKLGDQEFEWTTT